MQSLMSFLPWNWGDAAQPSGLDLGNGQVLAPEDVLDGHSARLLADRERTGIQTVPVQVHDNLSAAITVLAPQLAPLTNLAAEVAAAVPAVAPEPAFRRNLYEALERTHRQYRTQEALGTRPLPRHDSRHHVALRVSIVASIVLAVCAAGLVAWLARRRAVVRVIPG